MRFNLYIKRSCSREQLWLLNNKIYCYFKKIMLIASYLLFQYYSATHFNIRFLKI